MSVRLFLGVPGAGKTQAMCDFVSAERDKASFHVPDRANEWSDSTSKRWRGNAPRILVMDPSMKGSFDESARRNIINFIRENSPCLFTYQNGWEDLEVAQLVHECGDAVYCDDEIDLMAHYKGWKENPLRDFVHRGRHLPDIDGIPRQVHIMGAARRPENLHTDLSSLADEVLVFRCAGKNTRKRIIDEGYIRPEDESEMVTMPDLHFFIWRSDGSIAKGFLDNPYAGEPKR